MVIDDKNKISEFNSKSVDCVVVRFSLQQTPYMEATLNQQIPGNTTIMDSPNVSVGSVSSIPNTETPPPGYMSEDGDPMDQNENMSESLLVSQQNV